MPNPIVCPFCPLHCDDLQSDDLQSGNGSLGVDCPIALNAFGHEMQSSMPQRGLDQLKLPAVPIVQIANPTIEESKRLQVLVQESRIRLKVADSEVDRAFAATASRDGFVSATLSDVLSHADFIWVIGTTGSRWPRLLEKLKRTGAPLRTDKRVSTKTLSNLIAHGSGGPPQHLVSDSIADQVAAMATQSNYTATVVGEDAFDAGAATISAELITRLVSDWNVAYSDDSLRRAVLLRFSSSESLRNVFRWRSNQTVDRCGTDDAPDISLGAPANTDRTVALQIGGRDPGPPVSTAYAPASLPGVNSPGTVIRGDGSVSLPLCGSFETDLPTRIDVLESLTS